MVNGLPSIEYKVGFRLYIDEFPEWKNYCKYWVNEKGFNMDDEKRKYFGDVVGFDETIAYHSKRIQK